MTSRENRSFAYCLDSPCLHTIAGAGSGSGSGRVRPFQFCLDYLNIFSSLFRKKN